MSSALKSRGTKIQVDTLGTAPWSFASIPEAKDIEFPSPNVAEIDVTNQDSPANSKEFVGGDIDYGQVTFSCNYLYADTRHVALIADAATSVKRQYRVLLAGSVLAVQFEAYVQSVKRRGPVDGVYAMDVVLRVTGAPSEDTTP
jgi:hypothetical protein